jgi:predicted RNA methylase
MSAPRPLESDLLAPAELALRSAVEGRERGGFELRLQVLEAASARFGGFDLATFHRVFGVKPRFAVSDLLEFAASVASAIERSPIHPALALSALARETLHEHDRRSTGAYHTDFRLANRLAELAAPRLSHKSRVIDPACGAGILLTALTLAVCGMDRAKTSVWLSQGVCAADLSTNALRATLLSLASLTDDLAALKAMRARWLCGDSLMVNSKVWKRMAPEGFNAVIGNPPWEKVKLSRHEFLKSSGTHRHYGAKIQELDEARFAAQRNEVASYSRVLLTRYPDLGCGEPDLYIAFADLFFELCGSEGIVAALVPAGLIRSQGTQSVRQKLFDAARTVSLSVIDNRARFFAIDTRFKFLAIALIKADINKSKRDPIALRHERGTATGLETFGNATIGRAALAAIRPDLSLPEVRSVAEWKVFLKVSKAGSPWGTPDTGWTPKFCREVDMTKERPSFLGHPANAALPVVEGRMVQAHRFGVKAHISGMGRSAVWESFPIGGSRLAPQFWIKLTDVPRANRHRAHKSRIGFCDIAGQTNERSLMAALIPAGVVCGNKVPTILFPQDPSTDRLLVWMAIGNSFSFDWMLRRVLTTTVNYFLLESVPLPRLTKGGLPWQKLAGCAAQLVELDRAGATRDICERVAQVRGEVDAEVAVAYGLNLKDMELMFQDFPILDRGQPALPGEPKSTITRDSVLAAVAKRTGSPSQDWLRRAEQAQALGAIAYVPSEIVHVRPKIEEERLVQGHG